MMKEAEKSLLNDFIICFKLADIRWNNASFYSIDAILTKIEHNKGPDNWFERDTEL